MTDVRSLLRRFDSRRLAISLMATWAILLAVWIVPFGIGGMSAEEATRLAYSWLPFRIVYLLLALSTVILSITRAVAVVRRSRMTPGPHSTPRTPNVALKVEGDWSSIRARSALLESGYGGVVEGDTWAWGVRNAWAPVGTVVIHAGIAVLMLWLLISGALPASSASDRFSLMAGEGYPLPPVPGSIEGTLPPVGGASFTVAGFRPAAGISSAGAVGVISDARGRMHRLSLHSPWIVSPTTVVAVVDTGYTVTVSGRSDESSSSVDTQTAKLELETSGTPKPFLVGVGPATYHVTGRPVVTAEGVRLKVTVGRFLTSERTLDVPVPRTVATGDEVRVPGGSIRFDDIGYFGTFRVTEQKPAPIAALALGLLCVGTVWRLAFSRQEALLVFSDGETHIAVNDQTYGPSPDSAARLVREWEAKS